MRLDERLRLQGHVLFRWRSYLPLALIPAAIVAAAESGRVEEWMGAGIDEVWDIACLGLSFLGLAVRAFTVGFVPGRTSGRNTSEQRAESLNTTGFYSVVRHPLYLGNYLVLLGFALTTKMWWMVALATLAFVVYYERVMLAEEGYLEAKFGAAYTDWAARTPAFIPRFRLWTWPTLAFSFRTVLRREFTTFYLIVVAVTVIEVAGDVLGLGQPFSTWLREDFPWVAFFLVGTVVYLGLRTLKKHSRLLDVAGR